MGFLQVAVILPLLLAFSSQKAVIRKEKEGRGARVAWLDYRVRLPGGKKGRVKGKGTAGALLETEKILRKRLGCLKGVETKVLVMGRRVRIEVKDPSPPKISLVKQFVGGLSLLEFRWVLDAKMEGLDPAKEKARLKKWLKDPRNLALVEDDPRAVAIFNDLPPEEGGPIATGKIRWAPFKGKVSASGFGLMIPSKRGPLAFVPLRMDVRGFTGKELDPGELKQTQDRYGLPAVSFAFKKEAARTFMHLTEKYKNHPLAILINGAVRSCPVVQGKLPGRGIITGGAKGFSENEVRDLLKALKSGCLPSGLILVEQGEYRDQEKGKKTG